MIERSEISIHGRGLVDAKPDGACLLLKFSATSLDYSEALCNLNQKTSAINNALSKAGAQAIGVTKAYFIAEQWDHQYDEDKKKFLGHKATQVIEVTIPLDRELLGRVTKQLALSNADPSITVEFVVRDMSEVMLLARKRAVENAKATAHDLAESADLLLQNVKSITYKSQSCSRSSSLDIKLDSHAEYSLDFTPDVNPDVIQAEETVSIIWYASPSGVNSNA
jgi:uncharacterized protein YggE